MWRYSLPACELVGLTDTDVISVSPLIVQALGMDYDGDSAAIYKLHDAEALEEVYNNAFLKNLIKYEHNDSFLHTISNEANYAFEVLKHTEFDIDEVNVTEIQNLNQVIYSENISINKKYKFENNFYTYGMLLLNSWCELDKILITKTTSSGELSKIIYESVDSNYNYHRVLNELSRKLNWFLTTYSSETLTIPFDEACELLDKSKDDKVLHNLPRNPHIGFIIYDAIADNTYGNLPKDSQLYKLTLAKFRKTQFSKSLLNIGYLADSRGDVISTPVNGCVLGGLTETAFFDSSFGTRKALN